MKAVSYKMEAMRNKVIYQLMKLFSIDRKEAVKHINECNNEILNQ